MANSVLFIVTRALCCSNFLWMSVFLVPILPGSQTSGLIFFLVLSYNGDVPQPVMAQAILYKGTRSVCECVCLPRLTAAATTSSSPDLLQLPFLFSFFILVFFILPIVGNSVLQFVSPHHHLQKTTPRPQHLAATHRLAIPFTTWMACVVSWGRLTRRVRVKGTVRAIQKRYSTRCPSKLAQWSAFFYNSFLGFVIYCSLVLLLAFLLVTFRFCYCFQVWLLYFFRDF